QLTPPELAPETRPNPSLELLRRAVLHDREKHPGADAEIGSFDARELLLDYELLDGVGAATPRLRPVRKVVTGLDQCASPLAQGKRVMTLPERSRLGAERLALLRGQVDDDPRS